MCVVNLQVYVHTIIKLLKVWRILVSHSVPKLLGLSKYTRIAQWCAMRGTLQEELNVMIANEIQKQTGSEHVGVYVLQHMDVVRTEALEQIVV